MARNQALRDTLIELLTGGSAHGTFEQILANVPPAMREAQPEGLPYTPWRLLEHMRTAQRDILEFSRSGEYESPAWPEEFWPGEPGPEDGTAWDESVQAFLRDNRALQEMVSEPGRDLLEPFPHGQGQNLLREAMLAADHTSYHLGQLVCLERLLGVLPLSDEPPDSL